MASAVNGSSAPTKKRAWRQWIVGIVFLVAGGTQLARGVHTFRLPACDAEVALDAVKRILAEKGAPLTKLESAKLVAEKDKQRDCSAYIETADEKAQIAYHVFWDGWSKSVMIDAVTPVTANPDAGVGQG